MPQCIGSFPPPAGMPVPSCGPGHRRLFQTRSGEVNPRRRSADTQPGIRWSVPGPLEETWPLTLQKATATSSGTTAVSPVSSSCEDRPTRTNCCSALEYRDHPVRRTLQARQQVANAWSKVQARVDGRSKPTSRKSNSRTERPTIAQVDTSTRSLD